MPELFTSKFVDTMYINMWQYMNPEVVNGMFSVELSKKKILFSTQKDVNDDIFSKSQKNTICFKGDPDTGGHWVYVDKKGQPQSTYENNLIYQEDDGVCHGAAMIYALGYDKTLFPLIENPKNKAQFKNNYRSLVSFYIYLIESKKWESSFNYYFQGIKNRKAKINKSLDTLKDFRDKF